MKQENFIIRKATIKDLKTLHDFNVDLVKYEFRFDPVKKKPRKKKRYPNVYNALRKKLKKKNYQFFIAEDKGKPIAFIEGCIEKVPNFFKYSKRGNIGPTFIKKEYRNKMAGTKLVKAILDWFKSKKVKWVQVTTHAGNVNSLNFWRKKKFKDYAIRLNLFLK